MQRLLHISDLHFGPPLDRNAADAVLSLAHETRLSAIVISGDLTQRAKRAQFLDASRFIADLPRVPMLIVPGNHDVPLYRIFERILAPHRLYRELISPELNPVVRLPNAIIVGLDSTAPWTSISNGRIRRPQLELCRRAFEEADDDALRIVVAHHHFAPAPDYRRDQTMPRAKRAIDVFVSMGVELILGGHLHRSYIGNTLDFYPGASEPPGVTIVQCGTTTSTRGIGRERGRNSLNIIDLDRRAIRVTHYILSREHARFEPISRHLFPRRQREASTVRHSGDEPGRFGSGEALCASA